MADGITINHRRFRDALPRLRMALAEVGYETRQVDADKIDFLGTKPPDDVLQRAFEVCGIGDLWHDLHGPYGTEN